MKGSCETEAEAATREEQGQTQDHRAPPHEHRTVDQDGTGAVATCISQSGEQGHTRERSEGSCERGARAAVREEHGQLRHRIITHSPPHETVVRGLSHGLDQNSTRKVLTCISQLDVTGNPVALTDSARGLERHRRHLAAMISSDSEFLDSYISQFFNAF